MRPSSNLTAAGIVAVVDVIVGVLPLLDEDTGPVMQVAAAAEHPAQAVCEQLPDG